MELADAVKYLTDSGYLIEMNKLPYLTKKFYSEIAGKDMGIEKVSIQNIEVQEAVVKPKKTVTLGGGTVAQAEKVNWVSTYQQLIMDADLPAFHYPPKGSRYAIRLATKPGREAFRKAMLEGKTYDELLQSVVAYYHQSTEYPKKIENFFVEELWRNNMEDGDDGDSIARPKSVG